MRTAAMLFALVALLKSSDAILVTRGSPCEKNCGNVLDATHSDDLVCDESQYASTSAGAVFQGCTRCELASNYTANGQTDLQWMACEWPFSLLTVSAGIRLTADPDNVRYAFSYCLFGDFGNEVAGDSPCITR